MRCLHGVHPPLCRATPCRAALPRRCLHGVHLSCLLPQATFVQLCLGAACTGCIGHYHRERAGCGLCLGAACTGCIGESRDQHGLSGSLPRRCLHGVHPPRWKPTTEPRCFASALPARGASLRADHCGREVRSLPRRCLHGVHPQRISAVYGEALLCLGAACTGCIVIHPDRAADC